MSAVHQLQISFVLDSIGGHPTTQVAYGTVNTRTHGVYKLGVSAVASPETFVDLMRIHRENVLT